MHRKITAAGFTLVEVLVVVIVLGIASAIVVPSMLRSHTMTSQAASRQVMSDLLVAQNDAVAQQQVRRVWFEPTANRYRVTDGSNQVVTMPWQGAGTQNYVVDFDPEGGWDTRFAGVRIGQVSFANPDPLAKTYVEFDDLGSPVAGGTVTLEAGPKRYQVSVAGFTGRVALVELVD